MSKVIVGLTGGIGSGKSWVAAYWHAMGAHIVDTDAIARSLTESQGAAMQEMKEVLGARYVRPDGALDRDAVRSQMLEEPAFKEKLEAILHPKIRKVAYDETMACEASVVIVQIPLLVETGLASWRDWLDVIVVIDCSKACQIERVMSRNAWLREMVERLIANQASRQERLAAADIVIINEGLSNAALEDTLVRVFDRFIFSK